MSNPTQAATIFTEQQIMQDSLMTQKQMTGSYNIYAGECVSEPLRKAMLNILDEEHCIQADIFSTMQTHGWYQVEQAEQQKIQQAKQKLSAS